jgi:hypothetical protein
LTQFLPAFLKSKKEELSASTLSMGPPSEASTSVKLDALSMSAFEKSLVVVPNKQNSLFESIVIIASNEDLEQSFVMVDLSLSKLGTSMIEKEQQEISKKAELNEDDLADIRELFGSAILVDKDIEVKDISEDASTNQVFGSAVFVNNNTDAKVVSEELKISETEAVLHKTIALLKKYHPNPKDIVKTQTIAPKIEEKKSFWSNLWQGFCDLFTACIPGMNK